VLTQSSAAGEPRISAPHAPSHFPANHRHVHFTFPAGGPRMEHIGEVRPFETTSRGPPPLTRPPATPGPERIVPCRRASGRSIPARLHHPQRAMRPSSSACSRSNSRQAPGRRSSRRRSARQQGGRTTRWKHPLVKSEPALQPVAQKRRAWRDLRSWQQAKRAQPAIRRSGLADRSLHSASTARPVPAIAASRPLHLTAPAKYQG